MVVLFHSEELCMDSSNLVTRRLTSLAGFSSSCFGDFVPPALPKETIPIISLEPSAKSGH